MSIYISGSLAFDRIMTFPGNFHDHILIDKLRAINVSFMVDSMEERRGGCAGNIAYSMSLLKEKPIILAAAGRDFAPYAQFLEHLGLPLDGIRTEDNVYTSQCFITTDLNSNQITGFYPGAMTLPAVYKFPHLDAEQDFAIISPGNVEDMRTLPAFYKTKGIRYIYDPGQQIPVLSGEEMLRAIEGSFACITNDYELSMICKATGKTENDLLGKTLWLVTTLGAKGALVRGADGSETHIPSVQATQVVDPTGAGDAHRAGLLKGLIYGLSVPEAAKLGSVSASFAVEKMGTQAHRYTPEEFIKRYEQAFGTLNLNIKEHLC